MPCGKRPLNKTWDKPRNLRVIKPSRYEQNEASVKLHWKNVVKELELSYKDDKFWESQSKTVRELVGPRLFSRIAKIFHLPPEEVKYEPPSESASIMASDEFYIAKLTSAVIESRPNFSMSDFEPSIVEEQVQEDEQSEQWSEESQADTIVRQKSSRKSLAVKTSHAATITASRNFSRMISSKSFSQRAIAGPEDSSPSHSSKESSEGSAAYTHDDMDVHLASIYGIPRKYSSKNPHFDMLYCNESETDMIKWKSKYKQKVFEVSASDEFSKKAEIMTKKIAKEFYDWWTNLGSQEFKSEIKRPEDIEDLFQVWFDEHASRSLMLDPKILPCVLQSIANYVGVPKTSCPRVLKRQIAFDIHAETSPAHTTAFDSSLPQKLKHIPPRNNTETMWHCVKIPEDLRTMEAVWGDVQHLTSTKSFYIWLKSRPHLPMPQFLHTIDSPGDKKQLFVVPSDYVVKDTRQGSAEEQELNLPVSQFQLELKSVLSKLMND
ncbi:uncharacterized protein LOC128669436 [Plodia interpunctella]|uniref:uncharacterized protein LOC128669436 n=1 Tax=Plodia interpunctella TaxID=58824 RepID=UPI002368BEF5|nr:uncharacterized protein LOC128669436 [Plodia interpunctella]